MTPNFPVIPSKLSYLSGAIMQKPEVTQDLSTFKWERAIFHSPTSAASTFLTVQRFPTLSHQDVVCAVNQFNKLNLAEKKPSNKPQNTTLPSKNKRVFLYCYDKQNRFINSLLSQSLTCVYLQEQMCQSGHGRSEIAAQK